VFYYEQLEQTRQAKKNECCGIIGEKSREFEKAYGPPYYEPNLL
jgi:hypothetical protein